MPDPRIIAGVVLSHNGQSPGPASGITYTIATSDPNAAGVFNMQRQTPVVRWPDVLDTVAIPDGTGVIGVSVGARVSWHFMELPDFGACPDNTGQSQMLEMLRSGSGFLNIPTTPGSGTSPANPGGGEPAGPPAGEGSID